MLRAPATAMVQTEIPARPPPADAPKHCCAAKRKAGHEARLQVYTSSSEGWAEGVKGRVQPSSAVRHSCIPDIGYRCGIEQLGEPHACYASSACLDETDHRSTFVSISTGGLC